MGMARRAADGAPVSGDMTAGIERAEETVRAARDVAEYIGDLVFLLRALCTNRDHDGWGSDKCSFCQRPGMNLARAVERMRRAQPDPFLSKVGFQ